MRIQVDWVVISLQPVVPAGLDVRDLHGVADGLHVAGRGAGLRAEKGSNSWAEKVADWKRIGINGTYYNSK